jgi:hypothetical protein
MKCVECNGKLNCRNVIRLCKENPESHIFCNTCFKNHLLKHFESSDILCPVCNTLIYKKRNINESDFDDSILKIILSALAIHKFDQSNN